MSRDLSGLGSRGILGFFYEQLEMSRDKGWAERIGMLIQSDQESETHKWLGMSPALREWLGGRHAKGLRENGITITNKKFEASLEIGVDDLRRDKTGQIEVRVGEMADRVVQHWASLLSTLIVNGTSGLCYDGSAFYATDHVDGDSGSYKNKLTSSEVTALNVATPAAPTSEEMALAILGVIGHMYSFKDDQGEPLNEDARKFLVHVPANLWSPTAQAVTKNMLASSGGAIDNPLKGLDNLDVSLAVNPRFSGTSVFYVHRLDGRAKPFILQNELDLQTTWLDENSEYAVKTDNMLLALKAIRNVGYGMPQQSCHATLS